MLTRLFLHFACAVLVGSSACLVWAGDCPNCGQGCCYREVTTYRCKLVPDVKPIKKTVYECKEVPYCQHRVPHFGHDDCCCPECEACPRYKTVLIKKEITCGEKHGTKCVVEAVVRRVPAACCRCGHHPVASEVPEPASKAP